MRRFFYPYPADDCTNDYPNLFLLDMGDEICLPSGIYHHWCQVLRAKVGDAGVLFDGFGGEYQVILTHIDKKSAHASLQAFNQVDRSAGICAKLALVMSRGDRMDYAIQKATELGVVAIQLLSSHHGEVHLKAQQVDKKLAHWQQVAISACEQCGLNRPPLLIAPMPIADYLSLSSINISIKVSGAVAGLADDDDYQKLLKPNIVMNSVDSDINHINHIKLMLSVPNSGMHGMPSELLAVLGNTTNPIIELLVGGEGGLSVAEQEQALAAGWLAWQIGQRVLRTETAPVVALAGLQALHEYLNH